MSSNFIDIDRLLPKCPWERVVSLNTRFDDRNASFSLAWKTFFPTMDNVDDFTTTVYELAPSTLSTYVSDPARFRKEWDPFLNNDFKAVFGQHGEAHYPFESWYDAYVEEHHVRPTEVQFQHALAGHGGMYASADQEIFHARWWALVMCRMFQIRTACCLVRHFELAKQIPWVSDL